jgi:hypothetical protein
MGVMVSTKKFPSGDFGLRWQSAAATPLFDCGHTFQSGVALRFPPQSKKFWLRLYRTMFSAPLRLSRIPFFNCMDPAYSGRPAILSSSACTHQFHQLGSYLVQGQDKINIAGLDRSLRHAEILRCEPVLSNDLAALLLYDLHPE